MRLKGSTGWSDSTQMSLLCCRSGQSSVSVCHICSGDGQASGHDGEPLIRCAGKDPQEGVARH